MIDIQFANNNPLLDTSMTKQDTWGRCDRQFYYRYVLGLVPTAVDWKLQWGTLWHRCAQIFYRMLKEGRSEQDAMWHARTCAEACVLVENEHHGDTVITLDDKQREQLWDTFTYYYEQTARFDDWDEILAVEESIYLIIQYNGKPLMRIRSTLDLLARNKDKRLCPVDHKTTGEVQQSLLFLSLDTQARLYPMSVMEIYREDPLFYYNMVAREVPPGYGHRSLLTESGKKRTADTLASMQKPEKYLYRHKLSYTPEQYRAFARTLVHNAMMLNFQSASGIWPRRVVKMGPLSCESCPYFSICGAELGGRVFTPDSPLISMKFTKDPLVA